MHRQIFVNLAVADIDRAKRFFTSIGFLFEPRFTTSQAACIAVSEDIFVMLMNEDFFRTFTGKELCDPRTQAEVMICLSCDSREHVDALVSRAVHAGGRVPREPEDRGFMYAHAFEDCDGHLWELIYLAPADSVADTPEPAPQVAAA